MGDDQLKLNKSTHCSTWGIQNSIAIAKLDAFLVLLNIFIVLSHAYFLLCLSPISFSFLGLRRVGAEGGYSISHILISVFRRHVHGVPPLAHCTP